MPLPQLARSPATACIKRKASKDTQRMPVDCGRRACRFAGGICQVRVGQVGPSQRLCLFIRHWFIWGAEL